MRDYVLFLDSKVLAFLRKKKSQCSFAETLNPSLKRHFCYLLIRVIIQLLKSSLHRAA